MAMKAVAATYEEDKEEAFINLYKKQLENNIKFYNDYVRVSAKLIKDYNLNYASNYFETQFAEEDPKHHWTNYGGIRPRGSMYEDQVKCNVRMNPRFEKSKVCEGDVSVVLCSKGISYFECSSHYMYSERGWTFKSSYSTYTVNSGVHHVS